MWDVTTRCHKLLQRFYDKLVEDLSRCHISQVKCPTLQFRDYSLPALRVLSCKCVSNFLPKIYCVDTSVAVEFDNDTKAVFNAKQIGDMHCEHRFTSPGVSKDPEDIHGGHSEVQYGSDEILPSTVETAQRSGLVPCIEIFENLVVFVCSD